MGDLLRFPGYEEKRNAELDELRRRRAELVGRIPLLMEKDAQIIAATDPADVSAVGADVRERLAKLTVGSSETVALTE